MSNILEEKAFMALVNSLPAHERTRVARREHYQEISKKLIRFIVRTTETLTHAHGSPERKSYLDGQLSILKELQRIANEELN